MKKRLEKVERSEPKRGEDKRKDRRATRRDLGKWNTCPSPIGNRMEGEAMMTRSTERRKQSMHRTGGRIE